MKAAMLLLILVAIASYASAAQYQVGDSIGWTEASKTNYSAWALKHEYHVGDTLVFNFANNTDNVLEVNRQAFDSCDKANSIGSYGQSPTTITITKPGPHWFICGDGDHCSKGQKFGIMVTAQRGGHHHGTAMAPAPSPSSFDFGAPSPSTTHGHAPAPTPGNGASSTSIFIALTIAMTSSALLLA